MGVLKLPMAGISPPPAQSNNPLAPDTHQYLDITNPTQADLTSKNNFGLPTAAQRHVALQEGIKSLSNALPDLGAAAFRGAKTDLGMVNTVINTGISAVTQAVDPLAALIPGVNPNDVNSAVESAIPQVGEITRKHLNAGTVELGLANVVDMAASSIPGTGITRGSLIAAAEVKFPQIATADAQHGEGIRFASELVASSMFFGAGVSIARSAGFLGSALAKVPYVRTLLSTGASNRALAEGYKTALTKAGISGVSQTAASANAIKLSAYGTIATDTIKEAVAGEAVMWAFSNTSETIYPDSWGAWDYIALASGMTGVIAGVRSINFAYKARGAAAEASKLASAFREGSQAGGSKLGGFSTPGARSSALTENVKQLKNIREVTRNAANNPASTELIRAKADEFNSIATGVASLIQEDMRSMFADRPTPWTTSTRFDTTSNAGQGYIETLKLATENETHALINVVSAEVDLAKAPTLHKVETARIDGKLISLSTKALAEDAKTGAISPETSAAISKTQEQKRLAEQATFTVLTPSGDYFHTGSLGAKLQLINPKIKESTTTDLIIGATKVFNATSEAQTLGALAKFKVAISEVGDISVSSAKLSGLSASSTSAEFKEGPQVINNVNVTGLIDIATEKQIRLRSREFEKTKRELTDAYQPHTTTAKSKLPDTPGVKLHASLSKEAKSVQATWSVSPKKSQIRELQQADSAIYKELYDTYQPWRDKLANIANYDGTVTVYRGEKPDEIAAWAASKKPNFKGSINDIVSMTSNIGVASNFAGATGRVIVRNVPVEDFIMPAGLTSDHGFGNEYEFVVKGNAKRVENTTVNTKGEILTKSEVLNRDNFLAMNPKEMKMVYDTAATMVERRTSAKPLLVSANDHYVKLDAVAEMIDRAAAKGEQLNIKYINGLTSSEDAAMASIVQKFDDFTAHMDLRKLQLSGKLKTDVQTIADANAIKMILNLPTLPTGEAHPLGELFNYLYTTKTPLTSAIKTMEDLQAVLKGADLMPHKFSQLMDASVPFETRGNMIAPKEGRKPVLLVGQDKPVDFYMSSRIAEQNAIEHQTAVDILESNPDLVPVIKMLSQEINGVPERLAAARDVGSLSTAALNRSIILSTEVTAGLNPALTAIKQIEEITDSKGRNIIADILAGPRQAAIDSVLAPGNKALQDEVALYYHARRIRWEVEAAPVANGDRMGLTLVQKNEKNKALWFKMFNEPMPKDAKLPHTAIQPGQAPQTMWLSKEAASYARTEADLRGLTLDHENRINASRNMPQIIKREWSVHPVNFANKDTAFVMDLSNNEIVSIHGGVNPAQALREAEQARSNLGAGYVVQSQQEVAKIHNLNNETFHQLVDYSVSAKQSGKAATGASVSSGAIKTGSEVMLAANRSFIANMESVIRRTRAIYFAPQLQHLRARQLAETGTTTLSRNLLSNEGGTAGQLYVKSVFGSPTLDNNELLGQFVSPLETVADKIVKGLWYQATKRLHPTAASIKSVTPAQVKEFDKLTAQLGGKEYSPFNDTLQWLKTTHNVPFPPTARAVLSKLNSATINTMLRVLNPAQSLLNLISLPATLPGVNAGLRRTASETPEAWRARTAAYGTSIDGENLVIDSTKLAMKTWHESYNNPVLRADLQEAARQHYFDQDAAEFLRTLTAPQQGWAANQADRFINSLSVMTDKSEELSRAITFANGYLVARDVFKLETRDARFAFAHNYANRNIGNYAASNKPKIFQGMVGMPLGLFQTFAWNFYQRIFGFIERGDIRGLAVQYASQATIFGAASVPGYDVLTNVFLSNYDGSANAVDSIRDTFGDTPQGNTIINLITSGTLASLSGLAFTSRGDLNPRGIPNLLQIQNLPAARLLTNIANATKDTVNTLASEKGWTPEQQLEIIASWSTNRAARAASELYLGTASDRRGALVTANTRTGLNVVARVLGMRTSVEESARQVLTKSKRTDAINRGRMSNLRLQVRALARADALDEGNVTKLAVDYFKYKGNAASFGTWLTNQAIAANVEVSLLAIKKFATNPNKLREIKRLIAIDPNL